MEVGPDRRVRRSIDGLRLPVSFQYLPRDRVLVAEFNPEGTVSERDFAGHVYWSKAVAQPIACQRLPNGHVFIASSRRLLEVDRSGAEVWSVERGGIASAVKRPDGRIVLVTLAMAQQVSQCVLLDARGQVLKSFPVGRCLTFAGLETQPDGRVLVAEFHDNRVAEYDADGRRVWSAAVDKPTSVTRLPGGHMLVASHMGLYVAELDRDGQKVWEYKPPADVRPWAARRR